MSLGFTSQTLFALWKNVSQGRRQQLVWLVLIMVAAACAEVISLGAVLPFLGALVSPEKIFNHSMAKPAINLLALNESKQILLPLTVAFVLAAVISAMLRLMLLSLQTRLGHSIGADFANRMYRNTLYRPYSLHILTNSSELISGISTKASMVVYSVILPALVSASSLVLLISILIMLFVIDSFAALIAFGGFGGIYALTVMGTKKRIAAEGSRVNEATTKVVKALQEGLGGIRDVLLDGTQETYCSIYREADSRLRRAQASIQIIGAAPRFFIEALGISLIALLAYILVSREHGFAGALPVLGVLALSAQRMLPVLQQLYQSVISMRGAQASLVEVLHLMEQEDESKLRDPSPRPITFTHSIQLSNLSYRYLESQDWVLRKINLKIEKGSRVGLIGSTGSGKSTVLDIIMGLLTPTLGSLIIDNTPIINENRRNWQIRIAHVPQTIFMADTSIAENIAFGTPTERIDYDRVVKVARQAQIDESIRSLRDGYRTLVGENGIRLSGGERQRIGIARALYKNADVLVFDEATSALDGETENSLMKAIDSIDSDITILMVAHRLTTLRGCDKIFRLEDGVLVDIEGLDEV